MSPLLKINGLAKAYGGVQALESVNLEIHAGEIHSLCGENGAGKSTLIKILAGILPSGSYAGHLSYQGRECQFQGPRDALAKGIVVIHQELALAPDLTVAENIFLGQELTRGRWLDTYQMQSETARLLDSLGQNDISPKQSVRELTVGKMQMIEVARALLPQFLKKLPSNSANESEMNLGRILILDEPTSALSSREAKILLDLLIKLKSQGLSIIYVSHKLEEVFSISDRITILRNGKTIDTLKGELATPSQVISMMVGRKLEEVFPPRSQPPDDKLIPLLSVKNWSLPSPINPEVSLLENISLDLRPGEILGLAGLMGSGRTELVESLFGIGYSRGHGEIKIDGQPFKPNQPRLSIARGLALVPEDRRHHGLMLEQSIRHNLTLACLEKFCHLKQLVDADSEVMQTEKSMQELKVKAPNGEFTVGMLSGGNQQKVVLAKWLLTKPRILFLDDPTRGVDVGAKAEIYRIIQELAANGMGIILISSENEEVLRLAHRIIVLRSGKIAGEFKADEASPETILELCAGGMNR